jgi:hypothetical protein
MIFASAKPIFVIVPPVLVDCARSNERSVWKVTPAKLI